MEPFDRAVFSFDNPVNGKTGLFADVFVFQLALRAVHVKRKGHGSRRKSTDI